LLVEEARPFVLGHRHATCDLAAEHQLDYLLRFLCAAASQRLRMRSAAAEEDEGCDRRHANCPGARMPARPGMVGNREANAAHLSPMGRGRSSLRHAMSATR